MVAQLRSLLLVVVIASFAAVNAASVQRRNSRPVDANNFFPEDTEPKQAYYFYYGGDGVNGGGGFNDICSQWQEAALQRQESGDGSSYILTNCRIVDYQNHVAAAWATEVVQDDGQLYSQTGPVGYSITGTVFVSPQQGPTYDHGGTCERISQGWCRDKFVPRFGVELDDEQYQYNDFKPKQ